LDEYAKEADCILIGPGLPRKDGQQEGDDDSRKLVKHVLTKLARAPFSSRRHPAPHQSSSAPVQSKRPPTLFRLPRTQCGAGMPPSAGGALSAWKSVVIDGGALQVMDLSWIPKGAILTPHRGEFKRLLELAVYKFFSVSNSPNRSSSDLPNRHTDKDNPTGNIATDATQSNSSSWPQAESERAQTSDPSKNLYTASSLDNLAEDFAKRHNCIILLKGKEDIVCSPQECCLVKGGNAGMTKGGTGDVLAGLVAALACKNDPFLAAAAGSYINKAAGDALFEKVGYYFNASDLIEEIPKIMKEFIKEKV
jgi:hypothetical protein